MFSILFCLINYLWVRSPNSYSLNIVGEDTIIFEPPKSGEDTYVAFLNPEDFSTSETMHLEPLYKNICGITIRSASANITVYFSFIRISKGFCETVDFVFARREYYDFNTVPRYVNACIIYPTYKGIDFNFFFNDPYGTSEFYDSDSSQRSIYFAFNLIHKFQRNGTTSSDYYHHFLSNLHRSPLIIEYFHVWYFEDDISFIKASDKSYNSGATVCPNHDQGMSVNNQQRVKIIKRNNRQTKH